jgi:hypothetical protein
MLKSSVRSLAAAVAMWIPSHAATAATASGPSMQIIGASFQAVRADGTAVSGSALVGTIMKLSDGREVRIDAIQPDPNNRDLMLHRFSQRTAGGQWQSACAPNAHGEQLGYPLSGGWSANGEYRLDRPGFSIACVSGATGKCLRLGYRPWQETRHREAFQACTRMVRADYCGDGRSFTRDGTTIDVYDRLGIQKAAPLQGMSFEAAWSAAGAVCVNRMRLHQPLEALLRACPALVGRIGEACKPDAPAALVFNSSY